MSTRQKCKIWVTALVTVCLLALIVASKPVEAEKRVKMGMGLDLTGAIATSGAPLSWGAYDYLMYVNDELGGIEYTTPKGKRAKVKLDIIWDDNAYATPRTITIYKKFVRARVNAIANFGSTPGEAITGMASRDKMFVWGFYASSSPINMGSKPSYYVPYFGNIAEQLSLPYKWYLEEVWPTHPGYGKRKPRAGALIIDMPSLRPAGHEKAIEAYKAMGYDWVGTEWLSPAVTDAKIELTRMKSGGADIINVNHVLSGVVVAVKDAEAIGIDKTKTTIVAPDYGFDESFPKLAGATAENVHAFRVTVNPDDDCKGTRLAKRIAPKYGHWKPTCMYISGVQAGTVIAETIRIAMKDGGGDVDKLTGKVFMDAFAKIKDFDPLGLTPKITVHPTWRIMNPWVQISKVKDGKIVRVSKRWYNYDKDYPVKAIMPTPEYP